MGEGFEICIFFNFRDTFFALKKIKLMLKHALTLHAIKTLNFSDLQSTGALSMKVRPRASN
jgi:hypothetical protein